MPLTCSKQFQITVEDNGPCAAIFEDTVWDAPVILTAGGGSANGTFLAAAFSGSASAPGEADAGELDCSGTVQYTGPAVDCCVAVAFVQNDTGAGASSGWNVDIFQDGNPVGNFNTLSAPPYQFSLIESLLPSTITINVGWVAAVDGGFTESSSMSVDGELGDCP